MPNDPRRERSIIRGQPQKRPYGVHVRIQTQSSAALGGVEAVGVAFETGPFLHIAPTRTAPHEGGKMFLVTLEGFATAAAAEVAGRRLVQALLWMAVSTDVALRLNYASHEPAVVFERNRSPGFEMHAFAELVHSPANVFRELHDAYSELAQPSEKLLLSMEIFSAARLEKSPRAIFLALVSALEPLAAQRPLSEDVKRLTDKWLADLDYQVSLPVDVRSSLKGRIHQLARESVSQAIRRLIRETLPDNPCAVKAIENAYSLRSQIVHEGAPSDLDTDIEGEADAVSIIMRQIYSKLLNRKLARPI